MIVCHCNRIDHRDIELAADRLTEADEWGILTPVAVYKNLGKRPICGGCMSLAASVIHARKAGFAGSAGPCKLATSLAIENDLTRPAEVFALARLDSAE